MRFYSFLSGGFTTTSVINPPERKLEKPTSVHWVKQRHLQEGRKSPFCGGKLHKFHCHFSREKGFIKHFRFRLVLFAFF
jgi:hypothetical protein